MTFFFCVLSISSFEVHAGSTYFDSGEVVNSRTAIMHEYYNSETLINDIAIIVLPSQVFGESMYSHDSLLSL